MDLFDRKNIKPMLLSEQKEPFDSPEFLYELKLDGIRCVAYIDKGCIDLRNKRNASLNQTFPELLTANHTVKGKCILDGELAIINNGKPDFEAIRRRTMLTNPLRRSISAENLPACFIAFDILYLNGTELIQKPLMERKQTLAETVESTSVLAVSQFIESQGTAFYRLTYEQGLEGIVAKRKTSQYFLDRKSPDWIKLKHNIDEDFVACGYIKKTGHMVSLVLGQYSDGVLVFQGHVTLGVSAMMLQGFGTSKLSPFSSAIAEDEDAVWFSPLRVCTVAYMERTSGGGLRQPRLKAFRNDKAPEDCRTS